MLKKKYDTSFIKKSSLRTTILCSVVFIAIFAVTIFISKTSGSQHWPAALQEYSINGVLEVFQILLLVYMTIRDGKRGIIVSTILLIVYCMFHIFKMVCISNYHSLPGLATLIFGIVIVWIIYTNMKRIEKSEKALYNLAYYDSLTGLPNRRAFDENLRELIISNKCKKFALAVIDLDNFKGINDTKGHESGDAVLCEVARRWDSIKGDNEFLARQGGDEFIIIVKEYESEEAVIERMSRFLDSLSSEVVANNNCFFVSASFGLACYPIHSSTEEKLFRYADMAMYQSKISKTNKIKMFDISMVAPVENEYMYDRLIRSNFAANSFELVYQPQYKALTHELRGFETLLRMKDDYGRYINPEKFIPYAEKSKLVFDIDRWVLRNALREMRPYYKLKNSNFILSVNISALHLQDESLFDDIAAALRENDFPSKNLEIEITETSLVSSVANATMLLNKIKKLGIKIALDDFGTGYASLSNLSELPIDLLKIDKIFMDKMLLDTKYRSFVAAIISIGHIFNFEVISEGVEYEIQLDVMKRLGCDYIQGFLWGKPLPIYAVHELLKTLYSDPD